MPDKNHMRDIPETDYRVRHITQADAEAIADALKRRIKEEFYEDLGRGLWGMTWRTLIGFMVALAAWGALHR